MCASAGSLGKGAFERRTLTGSDAFLSVFTLTEIIFPKIYWQNDCPRKQKVLFRLTCVNTPLCALQTDKLERIVNTRELGVVHFPLKSYSTKLILRVEFTRAGVTCY